MKIGIGLPNPVPGTSGAQLLEFARRAEQRGFAALATIDRVAYPSYDSLTTLAAAAGATTQIGLTTNILLAPVYPPALLAKTTASLDQLCGGRLTLGLVVGGREDDFATAGQDFHARGDAFDAELDYLSRAWRGEAVGAGTPVCPQPVRNGGIPILIGGTGTNAIRRTVQYGAGWTVGGGTPEMAAPVAAMVRAAWSDAGRDGEPRVAALAYLSLCSDAERNSRRYLQDYYAFLGDYVDTIADGALRSASAIHAALHAFEDVGMTELYFDATTSAPDQVDRLADIVFH